MSDAAGTTAARVLPPDGSKDRNPFGEVRPLCAMAMGTLGIEVLLVKLLYDHAIPLAAAGVLHLAVVAVLGWWTSRLKKAQRDLRLPLLLVAATGFVGPIGTSGTLVALGLWILYSRSSTPFEE